MNLGRRGFSVVLLIFGAIFCVYVVLLADPIAAQSDGGAGLSPGTPARGGNTDNPSAPPNMVTISAADCTVADTGASITLEDGDGTRARFIDGQDVEITATESEIRIEVLSDEFLNDVASFPDASDRSFDTDGDYTVVTSTGIACAGGGTGGTIVSRDQSNIVSGDQSNDVIRNTIPNKPLPPTGGWPVYMMVAGYILAGAALLGVGIGLRRGRR